jgi:hypothetical protein
MIRIRSRLAAEGADPTLGIGVRVWGSDRRADDLHVLAAEELIESATEFAIAVVKQKPEGLLPVGEEHQQVSRLLCDPAPIWIARARDELDPTTLERDEEQDVDAGQPDRFDPQEVASEQRRCLLAQDTRQLSPSRSGAGGSRLRIRIARTELAETLKPRPRSSPTIRR